MSESQNLFYKTFHFSFFWNQTVFTNKQIVSCENATEYKISPWLDEIDLFFPVSFYFSIDHMILSADTNVSDGNLQSPRKPGLVYSLPVIFYLCDTSLLKFCSRWDIGNMIFHRRKNERCWWLCRFTLEGLRQGTDRHE